MPEDSICYVFKTFLLNSMFVLDLCFYFGIQRFLAEWTGEHELLVKKSERRWKLVQALIALWKAQWNPAYLHNAILQKGGQPWGAVPAYRISYGGPACLLNIKEEIWHCSIDFPLRRFNDEPSQLNDSLSYCCSNAYHSLTRIRSSRASKVYYVW